MDYNTQKGKLHVPEYGRNIQLLVEKLKTIPDKNLRTKGAYEIVNLMAQLNPGAKQQGENNRTLWEHFFMIADYDIDIDAPFSPPKKEEIFINRKQKLINYPKGKPRFHFYGRNVELMIEKILALDNEAEKEKLIAELGSYMRYCYKQWNDDKVSDEVILNHIYELSGGKLNPGKLPPPVKMNDVRGNNGNNRGKKKRNKRKNNYR